MKRISILLLSVVMLFSFAACNNNQAKQAVSDYMGEWKANSLKARIDNEIIYQVSTITLHEDGTCIYKGKSAKWEYDAELDQIAFTLDDNKASGVLKIAEENGKIVLKYDAETYYRPDDFVAKDKEYFDSGDANINDSGENTMKFSFESLQDNTLMAGTSYFMDFGDMGSAEDAAIAEGKLLSAFGQPESVSEDYENSFNYIIRATSDNGKSIILTVYGMGVVHIGAPYEQQDDFAKEAALALIDYVDSFASADYSRTVYYLDFAVQIDIQVKDGKATLNSIPITEEKAYELIDKWYK